MINQAAVFHRTSSEYKIPLAKDELSLRLICARENLEKVKIIWWKRNFQEHKNTQEMELYARTKIRDDYRLTLKTQERTHYIQYCFQIINKEETLYFSQRGFTKEFPEEPWFEHLWTNDNEILKEPKWAMDVVYYQIFPDRFARSQDSLENKDLVSWGSKPTRDNYMGGNLKGIQEHLDYFVNLGIDVIYLCPIFKGAFNHRYATINYFEIDPMLGTEKDLVELVQKLHKKGIKIILDGVFNHVATEFKKFKEFIEEGKNKQWFFPLEKESKISKVKYECVGDYGPMPKLNTSNLQVVDYIYSIMDYWLNRGIDGWRLDVADEVDITAWIIIKTHLRKDHPDCLLLGETWNDGVNNLCTGTQLNCCMNYQFRNAVLDFFALRNINSFLFISQIEEVLSCYPDIINHCNYNLLSSHDVSRFMSICKKDKSLYSLAICFQFLFIGSPAIFYGDEFGMEGEDDPDCRKCMNFIGDNNLYKLTKDLIFLRKKYPCLKRGKIKFLEEYCTSSLLVFERFDDKDKLLIYINLGEKLVNVKKANCIFEYPQSNKLDLEKLESKSIKIYS